MPEPVTDEPLVSIITPSYNQAPFLTATLQSVANQSYGRIEHIVMDGGSTDGSPAIISRWAETHAVVWRSEPDDGQADAINKGAKLATGAIIAWLNSDDIYLDADVVADVVAMFRAGERFVTGGGWYLNEAGERQSIIPVYPERIDVDTLRFVDWILQPATFVERSLFLSCPIDTSLHYAFDWDLFIRLAQKVRPAPIYRALAGYRLHETGKTITGGARRQRELMEVTRRYNPGRSRPVIAMRAMSALHEAAVRLPEPARSNAVKFLERVAEKSQRITNGRGIQY